MVELRCETKNAKAKYRLRNWKEFSASLRQRGSLTFWISPDVVKEWINTERNGKPVRDLTFTHTTIRTMLLVKELYHLGLRAAEGFVESVFALFGAADLKVPDHSTLRLRRKVLDVALPRGTALNKLHQLPKAQSYKV